KLKYVFRSPLFENISKKGYSANQRLLRRPEKALPCKAVGLGGISADNIKQVMANGWDGAAMLGWIWEEPKKAVERFRQIQQVIKEFNISGGSIPPLSGNTHPT